MWELYATAALLALVTCSGSAATVPLRYTASLVVVVAAALHHYYRVFEPLRPAWRFLDTHGTAVFLGALLLRYTRLVLNTVGYLRYRPDPIRPRHESDSPTPSERDEVQGKVTVIIPTVDASTAELLACLRSVCRNEPRQVFVVTVGDDNVRAAGEKVERCREPDPTDPEPALRDEVTTVTVLSCAGFNKRRQCAMGIRQATTDFVVLVDDHVRWPSRHFLAGVVAGFVGDERVGGVAVTKRVTKTHHGLNRASFFNMLGALYLERHNFEIMASNAWDGGVFVVSGRTAAYRRDIVGAADFLDAFENERFFFSLYGPMNPDDDSFITRWLASHGRRVKVQALPECTAEVALGEYPTFYGQCLRWARTTFRSNLASLLTRRDMWLSQPYTALFVMLPALFNFALLWDPFLLWAAYRSAVGPEATGSWWWGVGPTALLMACSKLVKIWPYFRRHPADLVMLPLYYWWVYRHSWIKLDALYTFWDTSWSGRDLGAVGEEQASLAARLLRTLATSSGRFLSGGGTADSSPGPHSSPHSSSPPARPLMDWYGLSLLCADVAAALALSILLLDARAAVLDLRLGAMGRIDGGHSDRTTYLDLRTAAPRLSVSGAWLLSRHAYSFASRRPGQGFWQAYLCQA